MAFLIEGMLLVFHLKGPKIEILVHLILVIQVGEALVWHAGDSLSALVRPLHLCSGRQLSRLGTGDRPVPPARRRSSSPWLPWYSKP